ncbi:MAG TPA: hypothetical protein VN157_01265 [Caulobacter sp.]|nr:hypothetical protein [Caulobacter sp.]
MRLFPTALLLALAIPAAAHAASFDCGRARTPDEKAVCAFRPLNDKDVRMSALYEVNKRTLAMGGRGALMDAQQQWLRDRRSCGANRACLTRAYDRRLGELERGLERIYRNGPF